MRTFKKITSIMLVLTMLFALTCTAFAVDDTTPATPLNPAAGSSANDDNGVIIIDNALPGENYSVYQIFVLESFSGDSYSYTVSKNWKPFFVPQTEGADAPGAAWVTVSEDGFVSWKDGVASNASTLQAFATAALAWADANNVEAVATEPAPEATAPATTSTVKFIDLNLGYYLVTSSVGTICSLDTTNKVVKIDEKNPTSSIDKTVENESYNIGETINFTLDVTVNEVAAENGGVDVNGYVNDVVIKDTMAIGFTFTDIDAVNVVVTRKDDSVELNDGDVTKALIEATETAGPGFTVTFTDGVIMYGDTITVTYPAVLNEKATIGAIGNENKAELTYGASQKFEDTEKVYTGEIMINKFDKADENKKLSDAVFVLKNEAGKYYKATYADGVTIAEKNDGYTTPAKVEWVESIDEATEITTRDDGSAKFIGLAAGEYKLEEVTAPNGYNKLSALVAVKIYANNEADSTANPAKLAYNTLASVANSTGTELPSTGGMGTKLFIAIGSVMFVGAGILLVTKRRMSMIED